MPQINPQLNMSFRNKKDRENVADLEARNKELRVQLTEQVRQLENRLEWESGMLLEMNEFYRRRAEIEEQYSKDLRKLFATRVEKLHLAEKTRSVSGASSYSIFKFYKTVLGITHSQSINHSVVGKIFSSRMAPRFTDIRDNSAKLFAKCKDMCQTCQEEVLDSTRQVAQTMKGYQMARTQSLHAEGKLLASEEDRRKIIESSSSGQDRRLKQIDKKIDKQREKFDSAKLKSLRERNTYLLQLETANACLHKYFVDDIPDILDCLSCGFHNSLARAAMMQLNTEEILKQRQEGYVRFFMTTMSQLDAKQDKLHFLQSSKSIFTEPKPFQFDPYKSDPINQVCANHQDVLQDLEERYKNLQHRIKDTSVESEELWKTLEAAEQSWLTQINVPDFYVNYMFTKAGKESRSQASGDFESHADAGAGTGGSGSVSGSGRHDSDSGAAASAMGDEGEQENTDTDKKRAWENGEFYLSKFHEYMRKNDNLAKLHARAAAISRALGTERGSAPPPLPTKPRKKSIIKVNSQLIGSRPRLFGGSIEELDEFPLIVLSCVRLINQFGLFHQGVFRVPGSQSDVSKLKDAFERGEDPFANAADGRDVNAAAGVMKLFLRDLEEPIFPTRMFDEMVDCIRRDNCAETVAKLRDLFMHLSPNVYKVLRFLFAFLNHLSQFSEENLMDSYNLSVCLSPSLLPVPPNRDPVIYQSSISHLIKVIIENEGEIFVRKDVPGPAYHKLIEDDFEQEDEEEQSMCSDVVESFAEAAEAEGSYMVTAKYNFVARNTRELTFDKGDVLTIVKRLTADWVQGVNSAGKEGLVPDAYVSCMRQSQAESDHSLANNANANTNANANANAAPVAATSSRNSQSSESASSESLTKALTVNAAAVTPTTEPVAAAAAAVAADVGDDVNDVDDDDDDDAGSVQQQQQQQQQSPTSQTAAAAAPPPQPDNDSTDSQAGMQSIDQALQEVIAGLESLTYETESPYADPQALLGAKMRLPIAKRAPDLVSDLPESAADRFALEGHADTLRMKPNHHLQQQQAASASASAAAEAAGAAALAQQQQQQQTQLQRQPPVSAKPKIGPKPKHMK